jgi:hypothetical protein
MVIWGCGDLGMGVHFLRGFSAYIRSALSQRCLKKKEERGYK